MLVLLVALLISGVAIALVTPGEDLPFSIAGILVFGSFTVVDD